MASTDYTSNVVSEAMLKTSTGFSDPIPFAVQQRFVGALRSSSLNNLEEQYVLGTDEITTIRESEETFPQVPGATIKFTLMNTNFTNDLTQNSYYILESKIYDLSDIVTWQTKNIIPTVGTDTSTAYYDAEKMIFTPGAVELETIQNTPAGLDVVNKALKDLMGNDFFIIFGKDATVDPNILMVSPILNVRYDVLKYKDKNGNIIEVAEKTTTVKVEPDPDDGNKMKKTVTKSITPKYTPQS